MSNQTTLTRSILLTKAKPRFQWVEIDGFGRVGIRSVSQLQLSRRYASYSDPRSGQPLPAETCKADIHKIIDQLMSDEKSPMFGEADFDELAALDAEALGPIMEAINEFNRAESKNGKAG